MLKTPKPRLFISHSGNDKEIVFAVVELIRNALNLPATAIRCTSLDGYRLPGGANIDQHWRAEILDVEAFIGLVSAESIRSLYVAFELGARWGAGKHLLPLLAPGVNASVLEAPLAGINALSSGDRAQLHQVVDELANLLGIKAASPAAYELYVDRVVTLSTCTSSKAKTSDLASPNAFSDVLNSLSMFTTESDKLKHISANRSLPNQISSEQCFSLLAQFTTESSKLRLIQLIRPRLEPFNAHDRNQCLQQFVSASSKHQAQELLQ